MDSKELLNLIRFVAKAGVSEVKYKTKDFEINIKTPLAGSETVNYTPQPMTYQAAPASAPAPVAESKAEALSEDSKYITIKAPMIGTFYRKPSPDKENFVSVGSEINPDSVVCVIEAMKLFNQIEAEVKGKIVKILVEDSSPVEYDQPLFLVDPS